eukprot:CAMPEP_0118677160 /NCGR_PEP_ID=MMETSP0800-20121206/2465_1 /TAXON_ID=210618 ORGANISM="Striatella unipunctata, Strain CCMP2910" /NCGR_SAMPLE_ID=MMETSP0800 /ASSEMBLY_ACC=CAM_ASM_000638 /LENGTH=313 /DNA_ID=CAMNT_0006572787 /DNA_START=26 /DNA_END=967 /DNA_ORIENTATION=+
MVAAYFGTFENIADLKFFGGVDLPWTLWKFYMHSTMQAGQFDQIDEMIFTSQVPILFKSCVSHNATVDDLTFFQDRVQNLYPLCDEKKLSKFVFESYEGEIQHIVEELPCTNVTLGEKLSIFHSHNLSEHNAYFDVQPYMMSVEERHVLKEGLQKVLVDEDSDLGLTTKMVAPVLNNLLNAGRPAVYYMHAHMDHFLSFCFAGKKTWNLVDPLYMDHFESEWSGNAQMMLKERTKVHKLTVKQEKGDILFVPSWWIHETEIGKKTKNRGFNIHFGVARQITFGAADLALRVFGNTQFFYSLFSPGHEERKETF